jgi:amino acid transporter
MKTDRKHIFGLTGSILLFTGAFLPAFNYEINYEIYTLSYFNIGDGIVILILAAVSFLLTLLGKFKALWITAIFSLAMMALNLTIFAVRTYMARNSPKNNSDWLELEPLFGHLDWGWAVMFIGVALLFAAAIRNKNPNSVAKDFS